MDALLMPLPPVKKRRRRDEDLIQKAIVKLWRRVGHPRADLLGIDVGAPAKLARLRKLAMGAVPGWPDLTMALPDGRIAFIEVKAPAGVLSPEQREFRARCERLGRPWALVRSADEALAVWTEWGATRAAGK